jgi:membrane dipeptidase
MLRSAAELDGHLHRIGAALREHQNEFAIGYILAMEGADAIVDPSHAPTWFNLGLRVASLVHYGHNQYAHGTGESGRLTNAGVQLLGEFEKLGIILDATHLSDDGFFHALDIFGGPVLASHQNCRALVPGSRQFTDEQLQQLIARGAVIGCAFDNWMLVPDWKTGTTPRESATLDRVADHIDHICQLAGSHRHAAIGTDLDGGFGSEQSPIDIETIADVQKLADVLGARGYNDAAINDIFHGTWLRFFRAHLPFAN